jgi:hypothetical protein
MKSMILSAVLSTLFALNLSGQNQGPIIMGKEGKKTTYQQNGKYLNHKELAAILKTNPESVKEYNKNAALSSTGVVFLITGFFSSCAGVVYSGLSLIAHYDDNKDKASKYLTNSEITLLSGLGLMTIGIAFGGTSQSHFKKSINNYNGSLKTGRIENSQIYIGLSGSGIGIRLRF